MVDWLAGILGRIVLLFLFCVVATVVVVATAELCRALRGAIADASSRRRDRALVELRTDDAP